MSQPASLSGSATAAEPGAPLLVLEGVSRAYQQAGLAEPVLALHPTSVEFRAGEVAAIVGKSGSGKTTLLNLACGIDHPTAGRVLLEGRAIHELTDHEATLLRRRRFGLVFQFFNLLPTLSVLENVLLPAHLDGRPTAAARPRALDLLGQVGMAPRAAEYPDRLSGGEQQRVAIARALINNPAVVLADEPTGNLDTATGQRIMDLLLRLAHAEQRAVILVTHSEDAAAQADRRLHMQDGRLRAE